MEWVETTAKTVDEAKERALDQLGVAADDAEFDVVEEPRAGLFGRQRGEARVRARVRPAQVRPKVDRRRGRRRDDSAEDGVGGGGADDAGPAASPTDGDESRPSPEASSGADVSRRGSRGGRARNRPASAAPPAASGRQSNPPAPDQTAVAAEKRTVAMDTSDQTVDVGAVRDAAVEFVNGLTEAFGFAATVESSVEDMEIDVRVDGADLGVLIGPGGRTLLSIQDLTRVVAQRRLHDHETRLRVDVAGYREKRRAALERFAENVAAQVKSTGVARVLDPMPSADRKVIHDALAGIDGVVSRSEGEDPDRRVVVGPA